MAMVPGLSESETATSGATGSQAVFPSAFSATVTPWLPMMNSRFGSFITATLSPTWAKNSLSLSARIGWLADAKFARWFCERTSNRFLTRGSLRRSSLVGSCWPCSSARLEKQVQV